MEPQKIVLSQLLHCAGVMTEWSAQVTKVWRQLAARMLHVLGELSLARGLAGRLGHAQSDGARAGVFELALICAPYLGPAAASELLVGGK